MSTFTELFLVSSNELRLKEIGAFFIVRFDIPVAIGQIIPPGSHDIKWGLFTDKKHFKEAKKYKEQLWIEQDQDTYLYKLKNDNEFYVPTKEDLLMVKPKGLTTITNQQIIKMMDKETKRKYKEMKKTMGL